MNEKDCCVPDPVPRASPRAVGRVLWFPEVAAQLREQLRERRRGREREVVVMMMVWVGGGRERERERRMQTEGGREGDR